MEGGKGGGRGGKAPTELNFSINIPDDIEAQEEMVAAVNRLSFVEASSVNKDVDQLKCTVLKSLHWREKQQIEEVAKKSVANIVAHERFRKEIQRAQETDEALPVVSFALAMVQHPTENELFVLTHERDERGWWLCGGGVDATQLPSEGAMREAEEEAHCAINLTGVLQLELMKSEGLFKMRTTFLSVPADSSAQLKPRSAADHHSQCAIWANSELIQSVFEGSADLPGPVRLRGPEPLEWSNKLTHGHEAAPLSALDLQRNGNMVPWEGEGDPPRAVYQTRIEVCVAVKQEGSRSMLVSGSSGLPRARVPVKWGIQNTARWLCNEAAGKHAELSSIWCVRYRLHVESDDEAEHCAMLEVVFVAEAPPGTGAKSPYKWQDKDLGPGAMCGLGLVLDERDSRPITDIVDAL